MHERSLRAVLLTKASNGYVAWIETDGHRQVTLAMSKGSVAATYTTTGRVSRRGIEADFGALGEVSMRFHGKLLRPRHLQAKHCRGRRPQMAFGDFRGTIRFEGENGYGSVDAAKARGFVIRKYRRVCGSLRSAHPKPKPQKHRGGKGAGQDREVAEGPKTNLLTVGGEADGRQVVMRALSIDSSDWISKLIGTLVVGATLERREGIRIERVTVTAAGSNALTISRGEGKPTQVNVLFPKPLEGRAELVQEKGSAASWTGSLLMRLPGAGGVPLTGPGLSAVYCRLPLFGAEETPCTRRSEALLPAEFLSGSPRLQQLLALQESGSHSQALADVRLSWSRYWRNSASSSGLTE
ncbi:MAG TPA: hypothetical protein VHR18_08745 [Solirubrobacterales bacterium]|nr:hypothetical protein [Solirubrobacterales bacterium]